MVTCIASTDRVFGTCCSFVVFLSGVNKHFFHIDSHRFSLSIYAGSHNHLVQQRREVTYCVIYCIHLACAMESIGGLANETSNMYKTNMG